jgi:hypothetical protein
LIRGLPRSKKFEKKVRKKLASTGLFRYTGNSSDKKPCWAVQKKLKKSEKKACQPFRNLITLPKPNQTNGETND